MDITVTNEKQLLADIDLLREQFPQTQDLYREVCVLLFFRYGMTPTANKLYQLVRKGSMTAPAEALNKFWGDLREKSRVRIEHPDLPDALKTAAGDLTATLWATAQAAANESLAFYHKEAQTTVIEAKAATTAAESARDGMREALAKNQQLLDQANERLSTLDQKLAAAAATNTALEAQLQRSKSEHEVQQQRLDEARRDFAVDLDKLRSAAELADERFRASETRALLEIDRERGAAAKLQKELDAVRVAANQAAERQRSEVSALQMQVGDLRQNIGILEGSLQSVIASRDVAHHEIKALQAQHAEAAVQCSAARTEAETWREKAAQTEKLLNEERNASKPPRGSRKVKG